MVIAFTMLQIAIEEVLDYCDHLIQQEKATVILLFCGRLCENQQLILVKSTVAR